jgi:hypothetical protein
LQRCKSATQQSEAVHFWSAHATWRRVPMNDPSFIVLASVSQSFAKEAYEARRFNFF